MKIDTNIQNRLTADEKEIFSIVREVVQKYTPSTEAFVAGGWVRDKLLGMESDDIDLIISERVSEDGIGLKERGSRMGCSVATSKSSSSWSCWHQQFRKN